MPADTIHYGVTPLTGKYAISILRDLNNFRRKQ